MKEIVRKTISARMTGVSRMMQEERGSLDLFALLYSLLVTVAVVWSVYMGYHAFLTQQALSEVARKGILLMEMAGGMTPDIRASLEQELTRRGLERTQVTGTPAPVTFRGDIELRLNYPYPLFQTRVTAANVVIPLGGVRHSISLKNPR